MVAPKEGGFLSDDSEIFVGSPENLVGIKSWSASKKITLLAGAAGVPKSRGSVSAQVLFKDPQYYTLQFSVQRVSLRTTVVMRALATISWNVQGNSVRRKINIVEGSSISGTGDGCNISVVDDSVYPGVEANNGDYLISLQITPGVRPTFGGGQSPILLPDENNGLPISLITATSQLYEIPQQAGVNGIWVYVEVPTAGVLTDISLTWISAAGSALGGTKYDGAVKWLPMPPGAGRFLITNQSGQTIRVQPMYSVEG